MSKEKEIEWEKKILKLEQTNNKSAGTSKAKGVIKDLTSPLFLITILLSGVFFYFQEHNLSKTLWQLLRPVSIAVVMFSFIRIYPIEKLERFLKKDSEVQKLFIKMIYHIKK